MHWFCIDGIRVKRHSRRYGKTVSIEARRQDTPMLRLFVAMLLMSASFLAADETNSAKLAAPEGWDGETIELPPGFAPDLKLKGFEHIRCAPGDKRPARRFPELEWTGREVHSNNQERGTNHTTYVDLEHARLGVFHLHRTLLQSRAPPADAWTTPNRSIRSRTRHGTSGVILSPTHPPLLSHRTTQCPSSTRFTPWISSAPLVTAGPMSITQSEDFGDCPFRCSSLALNGRS
jgi:hypothetical protein